MADFVATDKADWRAKLQAAAPGQTVEYKGRISTKHANRVGNKPEDLTTVEKEQLRVDLAKANNLTFSDPNTPTTLSDVNKFDSFISSFDGIVDGMTYVKDRTYYALVDAPADMGVTNWAEVPVLSSTEDKAFDEVTTIDVVVDAAKLAASHGTYGVSADSSGGNVRVTLAADILIGDQVLIANTANGSVVTIGEGGLPVGGDPLGAELNGAGDACFVREAGGFQIVSYASAGVGDSSSSITSLDGGSAAG